MLIQTSEFLEKAALPYRMLKLSLEEPDAQLLIPFIGIRKSDIADTWGEARMEGRTHEGVDIFRPRGTPVFSATDGYVLRVGFGERGGNFVYVTGKGGVRYYYAHLDSVAKGIDTGERVTTDTVLGFVGSTGNAEETPPHLHFGMYKNGPQNPYEMLIAR
jgi:murein DD-endopeptidase MepM/ murein hydrolase activator NlpD